jgi:urea transport system substrate-binding protein
MRAWTWLLAVTALAATLPWIWPRSRPVVHVGILHSLTGPMAASETPVVHGVQMAIDRLNAAGGVLGHRVEPVVRDGASEPATFAREAQRLIEEDRAVAVFGCWTSASRRTVVPIFERGGVLLFYPVQHEGLEQSPNVIYLGAAPNQQIVPAVRWLQSQGKRRFAVVGSDYVFPRVASWLLRDLIQAHGGQIVAEVFQPLQNPDFREGARQIAAARPDAILNLVNGEGNASLFRSLRAEGLTPDRVPTMSFSVAEPEMAAIGPELMTGDYAAWTSFQSDADTRNQEFVREFRARHGPAAIASDPVLAGYEAVLHWAQAVERCGTFETDAVRLALADQSLEGPGGVSVVCADTQHLWQRVVIGRARPDGEFEVVWDSRHAVRPEPYPSWRSRASWNRALADLHAHWGGRWSSPDGSRPPSPPAIGETP